MDVPGKKPFSLLLAGTVGIASLSYLTEECGGTGALEQVQYCPPTDPHKTHDPHLPHGGNTDVGSSVSSSASSATLLIPAAPGTPVFVPLQGVAAKGLVGSVTPST